MLHRVVWWKLTGGSEVLTAAIIRAIMMLGNGLIRKAFTVLHHSSNLNNRTMIKGNFSAYSQDRHNRPK
jgi:hypothetical protein